MSDTFCFSLKIKFVFNCSRSFRSLFVTVLYCGVSSASLTPPLELSPLHGYRAQII